MAGKDLEAKGAVEEALEENKARKIGASRTPDAWENRDTKTTGKRIFGEQLNDTETGEAREAHRLSRILAGRGMGSQMKAPVQDTRQKTFW